MTNKAVIRKAEFKMQLPVTCHKCGAVAMSEIIHVEVGEMSASSLLLAVENQQVGSAFPIGWGCYYGQPKNVYRCPKCV